MDDEEIFKQSHPNVPWSQLSLQIKELMQKARQSGWEDSAKIRKEFHCTTHGWACNHCDSCIKEVKEQARVEERARSSSHPSSEEEVIDKIIRQVATQLAIQEPCEAPDPPKASLLTEASESLVLEVKDGFKSNVAAPSLPNPKPEKPKKKVQYGHCLKRWDKKTKVS